MNTELLAFTKDLPLNTESAFKQDAKLAAAIDRLCTNERRLVGAAGVMLLPERKLDFGEVQQLLKGSTNEKGKNKTELNCHLICFNCIWIH